MINNALQDKELPIFGNGLNVRDWIYVKDHCYGILAVLERGREGQIYNLGAHKEMANIEIVKIILKELKKHLVESPHFFPDDVMTDQPEKQIFAEIIREKALRLLSDEIPHGVAVVIEELKDENDVIRVRAEIFCERESHKGIIIGKNGEMLKKIGSYAREDAEELFGAKVYMDLWVKIKENWRDSRAQLSNFGYNNEE
jgi:GTP-binding protein Era